MVICHLTQTRGMPNNCTRVPFSRCCQRNIHARSLVPEKKEKRFKQNPYLATAHTKQTTPKENNQTPFFFGQRSSYVGVAHVPSSFSYFIAEIEHD